MRSCEDLSVHPYDLKSIVLDEALSLSQAESARVKRVFSFWQNLALAETGEAAKKIEGVDFSRTGEVLPRISLSGE